MRLITTLALSLVSLSASAATLETWVIFTEYDEFNDTYHNTATNITGRSSAPIASDFDHATNYNWEVFADGRLGINGVTSDLGTLGVTSTIVSIDGWSSSSPYAYLYGDDGSLWRYNSGTVDLLSANSLLIASDYSVNKNWQVLANGTIRTGTTSYTNATAGITGNIIDIEGLSSNFAVIYNDLGEHWYFRTNGGLSYEGTDRAATDDNYGSLNWEAYSDGRVSNGVTSFDTGITGNIVGIDGKNNNIAYVYVSPATVPIPAAFWLFGSALAGLGWMRRRTKLS
jgi:hypothetical protein